MARRQWEMTVILPEDFKLDLKRELEARNYIVFELDFSESNDQNWLDEIDAKVSHYSGLSAHNNLDALTDWLMTEFALYAEQNQNRLALLCNWGVLERAEKLQRILFFSEMLLKIRDDVGGALHCVILAKGIQSNKQLWLDYLSRV